MYRTTPTTNYSQPVTARSVNHVIITKQPKKYIEREWSHRFCSCCDNIPECCCGFFCTLCYACRIAKRINEPCSSVCFGGMLPMRTKIRVDRKIKGSICKDFFAVFCCPCCAAVQMGMEAKETSLIN